MFIKKVIVVMMFMLMVFAFGSVQAGGDVAKGEALSEDDRTLDGGHAIPRLLRSAIQSRIRRRAPGGRRSPRE